MPGRPHHTEKMRSCVEQVMAKGKDDSSAYAICTTSLQRAGEPIFEEAESRSAEEFRLLFNPDQPRDKDGKWSDGSGGDDHDDPLFPIKDRLFPIKKEDSLFPIDEVKEDPLFPLKDEDEEEDEPLFPIKDPLFTKDKKGRTRRLHLRGALGAVRTEMWEGREHLVVPVVALMEGVIHAINADSPEFVSVEVLQKARDTWNGRPVVLGHPKKNGKQISASEPGILETHGFGLVRQSTMNGTRLGMEALIDPQRLEALDQKKLLEDLRAGKPIEVSVGAFVTTRAKENQYKGKKYKAEWLEIYGDHLAFLPEGIGACSLEMGCGAHRAAAHLITAEGIEIEIPDPVEEIVVQLRAAIGARNSSKDKEMIQSVHDHAMALGAKCDRKNYKMMEAATGDPKLKAACGCKKGETGMSLTKEKRAELIAALVTDKFSGYKEGDETFLETVPEDRLLEFKTAAEQRKTNAEAHEKLQNEQLGQAAKVKVLEEKLKAAEVKPTEEEWLERAPESIRTLLDRQRDEDNKRRDELVTGLKTAQAEYTEDELKAMPIPELERLSKIVKVEKPDFSGRGIPAPRQRVAQKPAQRAAENGEEDYTPPNPYEAGIKALQASMGKTVN